MAIQLPDGVIVYIGGKHYTKEVPDELRAIVEKLVPDIRDAKVINKKQDKK